MSTNRWIVSATLFSLILLTFVLLVIPPTRAELRSGSGGSNLTTFLVIRHADRNVERDEDFLNTSGRIRAKALVQFVGNSDIAAIYTTSTERTRQTVKPLSECLGIKPILYGKNLEQFASEAISQHRDKVVLVVAHGNTIVPIVEALTGRKIKRTLGTGFDDLHIVTLAQTGDSSILSLKYGTPIGPVQCR